MSLPFRLLHRRQLNLNQWAGWNFGGDTRFTGTNVNAHITFPSNWSAGAGFNAEGAGIDDRSTRGGPAFRSKTGANLWYYVATDSRKAVNGRWMGLYFRDEAGSTAWRADPQIEWRPTSFLALSLGVGFEKMDEDTQWVDNVEGSSTTHYLFGRIEQTTVSLPTRINYTITPTLSVQIYAEPFVSAGAYGEFKELVRPAPRRSPASSTPPTAPAAPISSTSRSARCYSCFIRLAISMAERAASHPLLPLFVPAGSTACCDRVGGEYAEDDGESRFHRDRSNALAHFSAHVNAVSPRG